MKIIKKGVLPMTLPWHGRCVHCGCEVEAVAAELNREWDARENGWLGRAPCPTCKCEMVLYPKPRSVLDGPTDG